MTVLPRRLFPAALLPVLLLAGCDGSSPSSPPAEAGRPRFSTPVALPVLGLGEVAERATSEVWVHGGWAYTGTHGVRGEVVGNVVKVWNVSGAAPVLVDSVTLPGPPAEVVAAHAEHKHGEEGGESAAGPNRVADLQVSDDGRLLLVATEGGPGSIVLYDLADPARPALITRYATESIAPGVHTAEVARVDGRLHAFLSVDPAGAAVPARLVIVDLGDPRAPREVWRRAMGRPYQHDVFVRDGVLFTAEWDDGVGIWDIGGAGRGGSVASPVRVSTVATVGGHAHNVWWFHDAATGSRRWLFVGEERAVGNGQYRGDVHVVDVADLARPREVAFFHVEGAGAHNFSADEARGLLFSAFYNAGVRVLDARGDLGACTAAERAPDGRCDLSLMRRVAGRGLDAAGRPVFVWGVHARGGALYASDVLNGLWKVDATPLH